MTETKEKNEGKEEGAEGFEIPAPVETVAPKAPTSEDLQAAGWSKKDIETAEKRGMVRGEEEKKPAAAGVVVPEAEKPEPEKGEAPAPARKPGSIPGVDVDLKPEDEKVFLATFGPGSSPRALYFRAKNERHQRQAAEERERQKDARIAELEASVRSGKAAPPVEGEEGEDPDDQPLTRKALREMRQKEQEEAAKKDQERQQQSTRVKAAQFDQDDFAKEVYGEKEFVHTAGTLAKDLVENIDGLVQEKHVKDKVLALYREFIQAAHNADQYDLDGRNASHIAMEIGMLHPNYGKPLESGQPKKTGTSTDPKANGGLTPEKLKRIEENTQRRASSASLTAGSGKRTMSPEDVDAATFNGWDYKTRREFRDKHPALYAKLRG